MMRRYDRRHPRGASSGPDPADAMLRRELRGAEPTPDLTEQIMTRLGYERASRRAVHRRWLGHWAGRCGLVLAGAMALSVGAMIHNASPETRRASDSTLPAAIGRDFLRQEESLSSTIEMIRLNFDPPVGQVSYQHIDRPRRPDFEGPPPEAITINWFDIGI